MVNFDENNEVVEINNNGEVLRKKVGKGIFLKAYGNTKNDDFPGIGVDLSCENETIPIIDVECDIINKKIIINIWEDAEKSLQELTLDF